VRAFPAPIEASWANVEIRQSRVVLMGYVVPIKAKVALCELLKTAPAFHTANDYILIKLKILDF
jgi:hypothetical protein